MQRQQERARHFASHHVKGRPLALYNAWDAGSAQTVAQAGAQAIGTSSWAMAAAHGYEDGESMPFALVEAIVARIARVVTLPVTVDVESGYGDDLGTCTENVGRLVDQDIVGINLEDRIIAGSGLRGVAEQSARIRAIRQMAEARNVPLFINARTDVFFGSGFSAAQALEEALVRAAAYEEAGASGLFVPGLADLDQIATLCARTALPVNVMMSPALPDKLSLAAAGVARLSFGPGPYLQTMEALHERAVATLA